MSIPNDDVAGSIAHAGEGERDYLRSFANAALWLTVWKIVYALLIVLLILLLPDIYNAGGFYGNFHRTAVPSPPLARYFETWDAQPYLAISESGYRQRSQVDAFYPLWPLFIRALSPLTGGNHLVSALVLTNVFSVLGLALLFCYLQKEFGRAAAEKTLALVLAVPGALFFNVPYSESLFLLLSAAILFSVRERRGAAAGAASLLSVLTRPTGLFWIPFFLLEFARNRRKLEAGLLLATVAGFGIYLATMWVMTGNPFVQLAVANMFTGTHSLRNFVDLRGFVESFGNVHPFFSFTDSPFDRLAFLWCLAALPFIYKLDRMLFSYAISMGILPAVAGHFMSYLRFSALDFPVMLVTAIAFTKGRKTPAFAILVGGLLMLQVLMLIRHINFVWVA
ncbi:MAG: hypothetical protein P4L33_04510 [Capsulimonadaceae bacterium]|nr:hypothetical protein [Capsulimonadaceae bacterium]